MDTEKVERVAQGRVWTGRQAKENGLIDELGGLQKAIVLAKNQIGLTPEEDARIIHLPRPGITISLLLKELGLISTQVPTLPLPVLDIVGHWSRLANLSKEPILALLPFVFTIH